MYTFGLSTVTCDRFAAEEMETTGGAESVEQIMRIRQQMLEEEKRDNIEVPLDSLSLSYSKLALASEVYLAPVSHTQCAISLHVQVLLWLII